MLTPEDFQLNSAATAAANSTVHHAQLSDIKNYMPGKLNHLRRGGIRAGAGRTEAQAQQMIDKIPPSHRVGVDGQSAAAKVKEYLADKDASHITSHSQGGSGHPDNLKWENRSTNRARGGKEMTVQEQRQLNIKAQIDNLSGALKAGLEAAPKGAVVGAVTTAPFSLLRNGLRVVRGELSAQDTATEIVKETAIGGAVGATTAFTVTAVAVASPPVAVGLAFVSPALLAVSSVGMAYEFYKILDDHKQQVQEYYESWTQQDLQYLEGIENELLHNHSKNLEFLSEAEAFNAEIVNRPLEPGVEGALKRYLESSAIAKSLGTKSVGDRRLPGSQKSLPSAD